MDYKWAQKNYICPVIYYDDKSLTRNAFKLIVEHASKLLENNHQLSSVERSFFNASNLLFCYFKQYSGQYYNRNTKLFSDQIVDFYTEREWRYLPIVKNGEANFLTEEDYLNEDLREDKRRELIENKYSLNFDWDDIIQIGCSDTCPVIDSLSKSFGISRELAASKVYSI